MAFYAALFVSRTDVYATRFDNPVPGKAAVRVLTRHDPGVLVAPPETGKTVRA